MKKLITFSEAHKQTGGQGKQLFRINCPIINLWNKQTVLRRNFFPWKASKDASWFKSKETEEETKCDNLIVFCEFTDCGSERSW